MESWYVPGTVGIIFSWAAIWPFAEAAGGAQWGRRPPVLGIICGCGLCVLLSVYASERLLLQTAVGSALFAAVLLFARESVLSRLHAASFFLLGLAAAEFLICTLRSALAEAGVLPPFIPAWIPLLHECVFGLVAGSASLALGRNMSKSPVFIPRRLWPGICAAAFAALCAFVAPALLLQFLPAGYAPVWLGVLLLAVCLVLLALTASFRQAGQRERAAAEQDRLLRDIDQLRTERHDMRHHLAVLHTLATEGNSVRLADYTGEMLERQAGEIEKETGNAALDALLRMVAARAHSAGVRLQMEVEYLPPLPISDPDLITVIGNLLDNALEGAQSSGAVRPEILMQLVRHREMVALRIVNSAGGTYRRSRSGYLRSTKSEPGHGLGLRSVEKILKKAGGFLSVQPGPQEFAAGFALPCSVASEQEGVSSE